jgi:anti-sigma-K factor RskA
MSEQLEPELERVAQMLAAAGPLPDAPATLRERALAIPDGADAAEPAAEPGNVIPIARRRRRPRPLALAGVAAAVVAIAIVPAVALMRDSSSDPSRAELVPRPFAPRGGGLAAFVAHPDGTSTIKLSVWKMPGAGSGRTYEAWLGRKGDRYALGTFRTDPKGNATITFRVPHKEVRQYKWLWVTTEPAGGSRTPSDRAALWGPLT